MLQHNHLLSRQHISGLIPLDATQRNAMPSLSGPSLTVESDARNDGAVMTIAVDKSRPEVDLYGVVGRLRVNLLTTNINIIHTLHMNSHE